LQISLLSDVDEALLGTKVQIQRPRIISLDVFVVLEGKYSKVALLLVPDVQMGIISRFIPYRLGEMRREVCIDPVSNPQLNIPLSFKRSTITISQVGNTGPGSPVSFIFQNSSSRTLAGEIKIFHPGGSTDTISYSTEPFICSGGCAEVKHSCPKCDGQGRNLVLLFGTRGRRSEPWCTLSSIDSPVTAKDFFILYRKMELLSARFSDRASFYMACDKKSWAEIKSTVDESLYTISLAEYPIHQLEILTES
jgi:hypothetical protein